jgi:hypothetical protein
MANTQSYWDGSHWTNQVASAAPAAPRSVAVTSRPVATSDDVSNDLVSAGYVTAVLFRIVGFIIGIVVLAKGRVGIGLAQITIATVAVIFYLALFAWPRQ